jgi:hypothetical protein
MTEPTDEETRFDVAKVRSYYAVSYIPSRLERGMLFSRARRDGASITYLKASSRTLSRFAVKA